PKQLELAKKSGSVLLGFNEPDHPQQANMTVQQALELWPHLTATGMRVGSPATAADPSLSGSWLEKFMDGAKARGYRVDFVCVHWYGEKFDTDGGRGPRGGGNSYFRYPSLKNFFHNCLITNDLNATKGWLSPFKRPLAHKLA